MINIIKQSQKSGNNCINVQSAGNIVLNLNGACMLSEAEQIEVQKLVNEYKKKKKKLVWQSEDKQHYLVIDENGYCEQSGYMIFDSNIKHLTFIYPFSNNFYSFLIEPTDTIIKIRNKTTTYIELFSSEISQNKIRWIIKGII